MFLRRLGPGPDADAASKYAANSCPAMFHAIRAGMLVKPEGMDKGIAEFFSLPVPLTVWKMIKSFQDRDFVRIMEECLVDQVNSPLGDEKRDDSGSGR